jgi:O-antigen/teichoic acid export membrane protein
VAGKTVFGWIRQGIGNYKEPLTWIIISAIIFATEIISFTLGYVTPWLIGFIIIIVILVCYVLIGWLNDRYNEWKQK